MPKKKKSKKKQKNKDLLKEDPVLWFLETYYRCIPVKVSWPEEKKKEKDIFVRSTDDFVDFLAGKSKKCERRKKKYDAFWDEIVKLEKKIKRCNNRKKVPEMRLKVAKMWTRYALYAGRDQMKKALEHFEWLTKFDAHKEEATEWIERIKKIPEGFKWMHLMEDNDKIDDMSKTMGYVKGITFDTIKRETRKRKLALTKAFKNYSPECDSSTIANTIVDFVGNFKGLDDRLREAAKKKPLRICFNCTFITEQNVVHCAIKGLNQDGYIALPVSSNIENPCPFCGNELHEKPPDFTPDMKCTINKEEKEFHNFTRAGQIYGMGHKMWDQNLMVPLLDQYREQYEMWLETHDGPPIPKHAKKESIEIPLLQCFQCQTTSSDKVPLKVCKGCDADDDTAAMYCSIQCAKLHWRVHKKTCKQVHKKNSRVLEESDEADANDVRLPCSNCRGFGEDDMLRCMGCVKDESAAVYCSVNCQRSHWKIHKKTCARLDKNKQSKI